MACHYSREELMKLKESPLVSKPASLPPIEEWMGPIPDPAQNNNQPRGTRGVARGRTDDATGTDATGGRRPAFEARKSAAAPESIILGPPKTNFASALGKNTPRNSQEDDTGNSERISYREKYTRDGQRHERDVGSRREDKPSQPQNRRSIKDDADLWAGARQPRATASDEKDKSSRTNGNRDFGRDKEAGGDKRDRGLDSHRREGNKDASGEYSERRNGPLRSRDVLSWNRENGKTESADDGLERNKPRDTRDKDRRGYRDQEKGWARGNHQDDDPLWLDSLDSKEDKKQAPTQADFEEFRAKMKAQDGKAPSSGTSSMEKELAHDRMRSGGASASKSKADISLDLSDVSDRFYEILSQPKTEKPLTNGQIEESRRDFMDAAAAKIAKSSKFSSLFNVDSAPKASILGPPAESASSEDKAGFQRILKLLDRQQQPDSGDQTPLHSLTRHSTRISPPLQSPPARPREGIQSPSQNVVPKTRDSEFLLNLMRQPQRSQQEPIRAANGARRDQENTPAVLPFSNYAMSPMRDPPQQPPSSGHPPGFFDEPARQEMPSHDKLNPNASNHRNAPPGLYDLFNNPQRPSQTSLPPGLERRPPGFDQIPPGFGQQPQQRPPPPPGFQRQVPQNGHHGAVAPGMFTGPRSNGSGMAPPGFMNLGGPPPPGFPSVGFPPDAPQFGGGGGDFGFAPGFQQRR